MGPQSDLIHFSYINIDYSLLLLSLLLFLLFDLNLLLPFHLLCVLFLNDQNALIELMEKMSQLRVDFVHQIGEVSSCFVINAFEEQYRCIVFLEVLHFVGWHLLLKDGDDALGLCLFNVLGQFNHLLLQLQNLIEVPSSTHYLGSISVNDLCADELNLEVRFFGNLIDEISNREPSTF